PPSTGSANRPHPRSPTSRGPAHSPSASPGSRARSTHGIRKRSTIFCKRVRAASFTVAVHLHIVSLVLCLGTAGCGGALPAHKAAQVAPGGGPPPTTVASGAAPVTTQIPEQLVIEGTLTVEVDEILDVVPAVRAIVEQAGGRVINEVVSGAEK